MADQATLPGMGRGRRCDVCGKPVPAEYRLCRGCRETLEGRMRRDAAIDRVEEHTPPAWMDKAIAMVRNVALRRERFTTDDIRRLADLNSIGSPPEPRAWGAVMRRAITSGLVVKTGEYVQTERPEAHRRPIPVYRRADPKRR